MNEQKWKTARSTRGKKIREKVAAIFNPLHPSLNFRAKLHIATARSMQRLKFIRAYRAGRVRAEAVICYAALSATKAKGVATWNLPSQNLAAVFLHPVCSFPCAILQMKNGRNRHDGGGGELVVEGEGRESSIRKCQQWDDAQTDADG